MDLDDILKDKIVNDKDFVKTEMVQTLIAVVHAK